MYNGIGLTTVRGSATSGHVSKNLSYIKPEFFRNKLDANLSGGRQGDAQRGKGGANFKVNKDVLEHNRKHALEAQVFEFEDSLREKGGCTEEEIEQKVADFRANLVQRQSTNASRNTGVTRTGRATDTHEISARKNEENERLRSAFGIGKDFVSGASFDPVVQEQRRKDREAEKAARFEQNKLDRERREREQVERRKLQDQLRESRAAVDNDRRGEKRSRDDSRDRGRSGDRSRGDRNRYDSRERGRGRYERRDRSNSRSNRRRDSFRSNSPPRRKEEAASEVPSDRDAPSNRNDVATEEGEVIASPSRGTEAPERNRKRGRSVSRSRSPHHRRSRSASPDRRSRGRGRDRSPMRRGNDRRRTRSRSSSTSSSSSSSSSGSSSSSSSSGSSSSSDGSSRSRSPDRKKGRSRNAGRGRDRSRSQSN